MKGAAAGTIYNLKHSVSNTLPGVGLNAGVRLPVSQKMGF